jgi:hypothetical protein
MDHKVVTVDSKKGGIAFFFYMKEMQEPQSNKSAY